MTSPAIKQSLHEEWKAQDYEDLNLESTFRPAFCYLETDRNRKIIYHNKDIDFSKAVKNTESAYTGKIILLTDTATASAAEETVLLFRSLYSDTDQLYVIGENTLGGLEYGNSLTYYLPNSGITVNIPSTQLIVKDTQFTDGIGFYPDYWSTGEDITATVQAITGDHLISYLMN